MNVPASFVPIKKEPVIKFEGLGENCEMIDVFLKLFPKSLLMWIASSTNEILQILSEKTGKNIVPTDATL